MPFHYNLTARPSSPLVGFAGDPGPSGARQAPKKGREGGPPQADPHTTRHPCNAAS